MGPVRPIHPVGAIGAIGTVHTVGLPRGHLEGELLEVLVVGDVVLNALADDLLTLFAVLLAPLLVLLLAGDGFLLRLASSWHIPFLLMSLGLRGGKGGRKAIKFEYRNDLLERGTAASATSY